MSWERPAAKLVFDEAQGEERAFSPGNVLEYRDVGSLCESALRLADSPCRVELPAQACRRRVGLTALPSLSPAKPFSAT